MSFQPSLLISQIVAGMAKTCIVHACLQRNIVEKQDVLDLHPYHCDKAFPCWMPGYIIVALTKN
jgi:hypothetical protein